MSGSAYERELKGILAGDEKVLRKVVRSCDEEEKENYLSILGHPFIVLRAAGSFGVDLVAIRGDISFPIEVKSSSNSTFHFSDKPRLGEQAEMLIRECRRASLFPLYAFRLKGVRGDAWRVFTLDVGGVEGRLGVVYRRIPKIPRTKSGNLVMRWEEGMPLNLFIAYLTSIF